MSYTRKWSGRRDSDPRHPPWQGGTLPLSYYRMFHHKNRVKNKRPCGQRDLNSYARRHQILSLARLPFRHARTSNYQKADGDPLEIRTPDTLIKSQVLCQLS